MLDAMVLYVLGAVFIFFIGLTVAIITVLSDEMENPRLAARFALVGLVWPVALFVWLFYLAFKE